MPVAPNHKEAFRPLRAGVHVKGRANARAGTIGLFALDAAGARYLVTCRHVLEGPGGLVDGDDVLQGAGTSDVVARASAAHASAGLDVAAARLIVQAACEPAAAGIGPWSAPAAPVVGQRVVKAGYATGVTEGVVDDVSGSDVRIVPPPGFPATYRLTATGDSGALWLDRDTRAAVALHRRGDAGSASLAVDVRAALAALSLRLMTASSPSA